MAIGLIVKGHCDPKKARFDHFLPIFSHFQTKIHVF